MHNAYCNRQAKCKNYKTLSHPEIEKKRVEYKNIYLINDSIYIFLKNSYVLKFNVEGKIKKVIKLNAKIKTNPIFVNGSIIYFNQNNNLIILD